MTKNRNSVLVTGGAGYIGSHVCKALWEAGYQPVTFDNLSRGFDWAVKWGPLERGSLNEAATVETILDTYLPVGVIHLAGYAYVGESVAFPDLYRVNNVEGSRAFIDVLSGKRENGLPVVFSSTCSIYGDQAKMPLGEDLPPLPLNPYAEGKLAIEAMLVNVHARIGTPFVALRYFNASGADPNAEIGEAHDPETHIIPLTLEVAAGFKKEITVFGTDHDTHDGTCVRDYVHVADLARAHVYALQYLLDGGASRIFNLANGRGYSVFDVIESVRRVTRAPVHVHHGNRRTGDPAILIGDARRAKTILNWSPRYIDLDVQVGHAWAWFKRLHRLA